MTTRIRLGARRSPLAVAQAEHIADALRALGAEVEVVGIDTQGDTDRRHLTQIGGTGIFAAAVREGLLGGRIDVAVHSMKDLPTAPVPGLRIGAVPVREDTRDVLIGSTLAGLAAAPRETPLRVGTGSPRRQLQLARYAAATGARLEFTPIRGNVDTRLDLVRTGTVDATVLAAAGLRRLGRLTGAPGAEVLAGFAGPWELLPVSVLLPAAGQGALAVEIRDEPGEIADLVARLEDPLARARVTAEREFLRTIEAGCLAPVGVHVESGADLTLTAVIGRTVASTGVTTDPDRAVQLSASAPMAQARVLGETAAQRALAQLRAR
ncbi:hydroxymethylbilane synthase [Granulicoccus phenolivorans]|uniref:hydroxymethylbilane synthase n=1 Tax=Granulicoccus phenolivorans TaxID=266854 RepID=UPI0003F5FEB8|nr:hydroxymethylbilane synthase [Granulicoccus phenolivorans]